MSYKKYFSNCNNRSHLRKLAKSFSNASLNTLKQKYINKAVTFLQLFQTPPILKLLKFPELRLVNRIPVFVLEGICNAEHNLIRLEHGYF